MNILYTADELSEERRNDYKEKGINIIKAPGNLKEDELIEMLKKCDGYIVGGDEYVSSKIIEATQENLKVICFLGTGYQNYIDLESVKKSKVPFCYTPKANARAVAEFTILLMMTGLKELYYNDDQPYYKQNRSYNLEKRVVGLIGMGSVGNIVAKILRQTFDVKVLYYSRHRKYLIEDILGVEYRDLENLLRESDIVSLHIPLTESTKEMIDSSCFNLMKKESFLINTSRANIVKEKDLCEALKNNAIRSALFDGFYEEPLTKEKAQKHEILKLPKNKFVLTPHNAYNTIDSLISMEDMAIDNCVRIINNKYCQNLIF